MKGWPIPVQPTAHYAMGGIPTDIDGRVISDAAGNVYDGLYAAGECACENHFYCVRERRTSTQRNGKSPGSKRRDEALDLRRELARAFLLGQMSCPLDQARPSVRRNGGDQLHRGARDDPVLAPPCEEERFLE
jgi:hypothetical protein